MLHLKGLVGQVGTGVQSGVSACPDPVGISTPQPQSSVDLDVQKWKRWRVDSDGRTAGGEDGDVADKGRRPLLRTVKARDTITQKALAVNVYLVCNSNDYGRY